MKTRYSIEYVRSGEVGSNDS